MSYFREEFASTWPALRVRFGVGVRHDLVAEITRLECHRALILTTPEQAHVAEEFAARCGDHAAGIFTRARMHTPVDISEEATAYARDIGADCLVAIGGGSTTGLGKAIALRSDLPQIVVPTTYAGSEATAILGQTENGVKTTLTSAKVQPEVILYDAELVRSLPVGMTVTSALNAMAHAAEGLYAQNRTPLTTLMALEGLRAFRDALPRVLKDPSDLKARGETLYGAWLCGTVLGQVGMALHHKLCHTLGGSFDLPHAETHAVILPHAIAYNSVAAQGELRPLAELFGGQEPGAELYDFARTSHAPMALKDLGLKESDLDRAADLAAQNPYWNPRPVERDAIRRLLQAAWTGEPPVA
ncbi:MULTISPECIES: maleylacetate reductase [Rhizobium/Agrobacterium group]|uniref:Maleylacetate reductase n=2 Tax=Rhizobium/Agrobacterium group TaxID=227290 RepID=B9K5E0_ALLAM|nr:MULTISPECIES: maleylacetate reductase [Rhizobium/Agrobacterium group]ACM40088.1 maleylacetate reductase [Allorhizobium ampelinum S4]MCF1450226.1 maleylacetate reductase [Allorhizobium ampelinum]MCF1493749.1 maleylacetate reductase [Allorhizobium ampelinum]MUO28436.1 iron-containing alcohol dehydrogenase [Agrobacterium vitis]MUO41318.1 iron-containing alcohol dehydrogenase [Agrobacterium vitis]